LTAGRGPAERHIALAAPNPPELAPEPTDPAHVRRWTADLKTRAERVCERLAESRNDLRETDRPLADRLTAARGSLDRLYALLPADIGGLNIRHHGDFRLGQT